MLDKNNEISELIDELWKRLTEKMREVVDSPEVKEILEEMKRRGKNFKSLGGIFHKLPPEGKEIVRDLEAYIGKRINQIMGEPKTEEKISRLEQYGGFKVVDFGILGLMFLVSVDSDSDKDWLRQHGISWN